MSGISIGQAEVTDLQRGRSLMNVWIFNTIGVGLNVANPLTHLFFTV
jgi:hypothetical protein